MTKTIMTSGEFEGWTTWEDEPFEHDTAGPFYFRVDEKGPVAAFRVAHKHMNAGGVVHGGCLMSFGDFSLFALARKEGLPASLTYVKNVWKMVKKDPKCAWIIWEPMWEHYEYYKVKTIYTDVFKREWAETIGGNVAVAPSSGHQR